MDDNEPPLREAIKPQINHNIVGESIENITSVDECADECYRNSECRFFTWYKRPLSDKEVDDAPCLLVGFNLRQACFNLENRCVLLRECSKFNDTCALCRTGAKPFADIYDEPATLVMNGRMDNRNFKQEEVPQYTLSTMVELVTENSSCSLTTTGLKARQGSVAGFVTDHVINCGGYSDEDGQYLDSCQKYVGKGVPWSNAGTLQQARAFASGVEAMKDPNTTVFYILGGYDVNSGFLDSVEKYDQDAGTFSTVAAMQMPEEKSHFCTVYVENANGRFLYNIGGWNIDYLNSVHRMKLDPTTGEGTAWTVAPNLKDARSDHACAVVQHKWKTGIMVAGGYKMEGAWMSTVEFFDFGKGEWIPLAFFPRMTDGRHYHGLTTLGLIPTVFGGWNNGSLSSIEQVNYCQSTPMWKETQDWLRVAREKFSYARVPKSFLSDCSEP